MQTIFWMCDQNYSLGVDDLVLKPSNEKKNIYSIYQHSARRPDECGCSSKWQLLGKVAREGGWLVGGPWRTRHRERKAVQHAQRSDRVHPSPVTHLTTVSASPLLPPLTHALLQLAPFLRRRRRQGNGEVRYVAASGAAPLALAGAASYVGVCMLPPWIGTMDRRDDRHVAPPAARTHGCMHAPAHGGLATGVSSCLTGTYLIDGSVECTVYCLNTYAGNTYVLVYERETLRLGAYS